MDKERAYQVIKRIVNLIILPEYPELKFDKIEDTTSSHRRNRKIEFAVYFKSKKNLTSEEQMEIDTELKSAFQMAGFYQRNPEQDVRILAWFKLPNEKNYSFWPSLDYRH